MKYRTAVMALSWLTLVIGLAVPGCATNESFHGAEQEALGRGIVLGTLGAQTLGGVPSVPEEGRQVVAGQVIALEGGAYLIKDITGADRRLPLDENTRIDRPAHVGDHIEAYLDERGRAIHIRNIDHAERDE